MSPKSSAVWDVEIKKPEKVVLQGDYEELAVWKIKQLISSMRKLRNMCFSYFHSCLIWKKANQISQNSNCDVDMKITSTDLMTAVHCSQFHKRALRYLFKMAVFNQVFLVSCFSCCVNRQQ